MSCQHSCKFPNGNVLSLQHQPLWCLYFSGVNLTLCSRSWWKQHSKSPDLQWVEIIFIFVQFYMGCRLRHNDSNCVPLHTSVVGYDIRRLIWYPTSDIYIRRRIWYPMSDICIRRRISYPMSDIYIRRRIWYPMSDIYIRRPISISDVRYLYPTSDIYIRHPISISDIRYLISDIRYLISDIRYLISDIRYLISDVRYLISDVRYLYPTSGIYIRRPVSISDVRYLYPTSDIYIRRPISISDVRYLYPTSDIDIRRRISISDIRYRYLTKKNLYSPWRGKSWRTGRQGCASQTATPPANRGVAKKAESTANWWCVLGFLVAFASFSLDSVFLFQLPALFGDCCCLLMCP